MRITADAVLCAVKVAVLAMALVLGGLANGSWAHLTVDHHAAIVAPVPASILHEHHHDHEDGSDDPAGSYEAGTHADHGVAHYHVDADVSWPATFVGPVGASMRSGLTQAAVIAWAGPPPQRPPPDPRSTT